VWDTDHAFSDHRLALARATIDWLGSIGRSSERVTRILVMTETLPLAQIKAHLSEIVDRVEGQHET
jgi:hypothetical protein